MSSVDHIIVPWMAKVAAAFSPRSNGSPICPPSPQLLSKDTLDDDELYRVGDQAIQFYKVLRNF